MEQRDGAKGWSKGMEQRDGVKVAPQSTRRIARVPSKSDSLHRLCFNYRVSFFWRTRFRSLKRKRCQQSLPLPIAIPFQRGSREAAPRAAAWREPAVPFLFSTDKGRSPATRTAAFPATDKSATGYLTLSALSRFSMTSFWWSATVPESAAR